MREQDFTLAETYNAAEAFVTGTLGGITPVTRVDGRRIGDGTPGPVTQEIAGLYARHVEAETPGQLTATASLPAARRP